VLPPWWGTGVAGTLHEAAIVEMRQREFVRSRLFTPADHLRARRFYERRGWRVTAHGTDRGGLGLDLVECRLEL
jgi:hypothetical protein